MTSRAPSHRPRKDRQPRLSGWAHVYVPIVWLMGALLRCVMFAGREDLHVQPEPIAPARLYNRQLRRARASCLRRVRRCALKGGRLNPQNYIPKVYAFLEFAKHVPDTTTPTQFAHYCARVSGLGRARVLGLCSAHEITEYSACGFLAQAARGFAEQMHSVFAEQPQGGIAGAGRAPP